MTCKLTMRQKIVEAAKERFQHYGYGKTTMAEVASDCNMSPGNLYRYFPGKLDIAEEIARESVESIHAQLREVVRRPGLGGVERLKTFLHAMLDITFHHLEHKPKVHEIAQEISRQRPEFSNKMLTTERALMAEILSSGNASGDFQVDDVVFASEMIQCATLKFRYPQLWSNLPLDRLKLELDGVIGLILCGVGARTDTTSHLVQSRSVAASPATPNRGISGLL